MGEEAAPVAPGGLVGAAIRHGRSCSAMRHPAPGRHRPRRRLRPRGMGWSVAGGQSAVPVRRRGRPGRPRPGRAARPITAIRAAGRAACHLKGRSIAEDARSALTRRPSRSYAVPTSRPLPCVPEVWSEPGSTTPQASNGLRMPAPGSDSWPSRGSCRRWSSRHARSPGAARQPPVPTDPDRRPARVTPRSRTRRGIPATRPATPDTGPAAPGASAPRRSTAVAAISGPPADGTGAGTHRPSAAPDNAPAAPRSSMPQGYSMPLRNGPEKGGSALGVAGRSRGRPSDGPVPAGIASGACPPRACSRSAVAPGSCAAGIRAAFGRGSCGRYRP